MLLRVCLGIRLISFGAADLLGNPSEPIIFALNIIAAAGSLFFLAGLWTPVIGVLLALDQFWIALSLYSPQVEESWIHAFLAVLSACVAMLGSGAWSIDARLFGRRRFDIDRPRGKKASS
jgi:uncharacterized membrane protein YphA (DoxX/SURF4 family)